MAKSNTIITEISEEDFRKLNLTGYKRKGIFNGPVEEVSINEELTKNIRYWIDNGYEDDRSDLLLPVTVAIHRDPSEEDDGFYFDKWMNRYSPAKTYEISMGIPHLYSAKEHYEARNDYWRVRKDETKAIYRVHLDPKWLDGFVLKHRTEDRPWPGEPGDGEEIRLEVHYDLQPDGSWLKRGQTKVVKRGMSTAYIPVDDDLNEISRYGKKGGAE